MLKELNPIDRFTGANCLHLSIGNMIRYKGYNNFKGVWKQCALYYLKESGTKIGDLKGWYMSIEDDLKIDNIDYVCVSVDNYEDLLNQINAQLLLEEPVLLFVDTYHLPDNIHYNKNHHLHTIIITYSENDLYTYVDDGYGYIGKISKNSLISAAQRIYFSPKIPFLYSTINVKNEKPKIKELHSIIENNLNILNGVGNQELFDRENQNNSEIVIGIDSINSFIEDLEIFLQNNPNNISEDVFLFLYNILLSVSTTRYRYADFLHYHPHINYSNESILIEIYKELGQDWRVSSNMVLKGMHKKDIEMLFRTINKLKYICSKEHEALRYHMQVSQDKSYKLFF